MCFKFQSFVEFYVLVTSILIMEGGAHCASLDKSNITILQRYELCLLVQVITSLTFIEKELLSFADV